MKSLMEQINLSCLHFEAHRWQNNARDRSYRKLIHNPCQETSLMLTDRSKLCGLAHKESKAAEAKGKRVTHKTVRCFLLVLVQCYWYANEDRTGLLIINGNYCTANIQFEKIIKWLLRLESLLCLHFTWFYALNDSLPSSSGENCRGQQVHSKIDHSTINIPGKSAIPITGMGIRSSKT